ncbi:MAG TPA: hypothetical protein EYG57_17535, partial [Planctomycetes bacterium]|nr:hypothetical protein [Planctomycetota bacterium]
MRTSMSQTAWTPLAVVSIIATTGCRGGWGLSSIGFGKPKPPTSLLGSGLPPSPSSTVAESRNSDPYGTTRNASVTEGNASFTEGNGRETFSTTADTRGLGSGYTGPNYQSPQDSSVNYNSPDYTPTPTTNY